MTRTVGRYVAPEMAALWVAELVLAFVVVYAMMLTPPAADLLGASWRAINPRLANHAALLACMLAGTAVAIGLYRPDICLDPRRVALNAAVVAVLAFPVALAVGGAFNGGLTSTYAVWLVKVLGLWIATVLVTRWVLRLVLRRAPFSRRVLVIGAGADADRLVVALRTRRGAMFELAGELAPDAVPPTLETLRAGHVWALLAAGTSDQAPPSWLLDYKLRGMPVFNELGFCERHLGRISLDRLDGAWLLGADGFNSGRAAAAAKRLVDLAISLFLLVLTFPLMLTTAFLVQARQSWPDALPPGTRQDLHGRAVHPAQVPQHAPPTPKRLKARRAGPQARPAGHSRRRLHPLHPHRRAATVAERPAGRHEPVGPRPERPHFVDPAHRRLSRSTTSGVTSNPASPAGRK